MPVAYTCTTPEVDGVIFASSSLKCVSIHSRAPARSEGSSNWLPISAKISLRRSRFG